MQQIWTCQALNSKEANELDGLAGLGKNLQHANFVVHIQKLWAPSYSVGLSHVEEMEEIIHLMMIQPCGRDGGDYSPLYDSARSIIPNIRVKNYSSNDYLPVISLSLSLSKHLQVTATTETKLP
nr:PREDICTED: uncharacterized protein LOC108953191 [Musa acuminata subsp. malaccensis]